MNPESKLVFARAVKSHVGVTLVAWLAGMNLIYSWCSPSVSGVFMPPNAMRSTTRDPNPRTARQNRNHQTALPGMMCRIRRSGLAPILNSRTVGITRLPAIFGNHQDGDINKRREHRCDRKDKTTHQTCEQTQSVEKCGQDNRQQSSKHQSEPDVLGGSSLDQEFAGSLDLSA